MSNFIILTRYTVPTPLDPSPYSSLWVQIIDKDEDIKQIYIQTSQKEDMPVWEKMGIFLERSFKDKLFDPKFISEALKKYEENK